LGDLQNGEAKTVEVTARRDGGDDVTFGGDVRIDTPNEVSYFKNGGILHRVLPRLALLLGPLSDRLRRAPKSRSKSGT